MRDEHSLSYRKAIDYILSLANDVERGAVIPYSERTFKLERPMRLLELLGVAYRRIPAIHIAGTKGKGSTAAMIASVLRAAGYRVGLFTSPHLRTYRERLSIDQVPIPEDTLAELVSTARAKVERVHLEEQWGRVTPFELTTALALLWFDHERVDVQVLETGLGGRLDATNIVMPVVAAITSISLDHTQFLGDTISQIASEKAGIVKSGVPVVVAPQGAEALQVIERRAAEVGAPLIRVGRDVLIEAGGDFVPIQAGSSNLTEPIAQHARVRGRFGRYFLRLPLLGRHQIENAATAVAAVECLPERGLPLGQDAIGDGIASVRWPGRLQVLQTTPLIVADAAHNVDSARRLLEALREYFRFRRLLLVFAASADKDLAGIAAILGTAASVVLATRSRHSRSAPVETIHAVFDSYASEVEDSPTVAHAIDRALAIAAPKDLVCVTGSVFTVAEALHWFADEPVPVVVV